MRRDHNSKNVGRKHEHEEVYITRKTSLMRRMVRSFRRRTSSNLEDSESHRVFDTLGGVFTTDCPDTSDCTGTTMTMVKNNNNKQSSFNTLETESFSQNTSQTTLSLNSGDSLPNNWNSSGSEEHHEGAPLVARKAIAEDEQHTTNAIPGLELGDEELLGRIMLKSRKLPQSDGYYASNHVMINNERVKRQVSYMKQNTWSWQRACDISIATNYDLLYCTVQIPPLKRMRDLDAIAREQAKLMASSQELFHAEPMAIQEQLGRECGRRIGENCSKGSNLYTIHASMMQSLADKNNILDRRFTGMGIGTSKADDGTLYLCQIFRD